jgi:histidine triad (HIT) family protein
MFIKTPFYRYNFGIFCYNKVMQQPSVFTRIINGEIPCQKIYEDDRVIAFLEMHPLNEGHTLVVPKKQVDHLWDLNDDDYEYLWKIAKKVATHISEIINPPRVGVIVEGFGVPHAHIHLVPIYGPNDLKRIQDHTEPDIAKLTKVAERLKM